MAGLASYKRTIAAGSSEIVSARGMLLVLRNSQSAVTVSTIQNQTSGKGGEKYSLVLRKGEKWFAAQEFDGVSLSNDEAFDQVVECLIGYGDYQEPPPNLQTSDAIQVGDSATIGDSQVLLVDENPRRSRIIIKASPDNAKDVSLVNGDGSGTFPLSPGESVTLQTKGAINMQTLGGGSGDEEVVYFLEEVYNVAP